MKKDFYTHCVILKAFAFLIMVLLFTGHSFAQWTIYDGSIMPNEMDPAFITASSPFSENENLIIDDPEIDGNKLLWMDVNGTPNSQFYWRMNFLTHEVELEEITVVLRVKGHPDRDMALDMDLEFNGWRSRVSILNGEIPEARIRNGTGDPAFLEVDVLEWNIYRFTMTAEETRLYINEESIPVMVFAPVAAGSNRHFRFGDGDSGRSFGADIDWVIWDVNGAYAPNDGTPIPQELLGPVVEEGWVVYDGSVLPNEMDPAFMTATSPFSENENIIIDDPDIEGNKLLWMDVSGNPNNAFLWRMNFATHEVELEELTVLMRLKGHPDRDMALDLDLDFNGWRSRVSVINGEVPEARIRNGTGDPAFLEVDVLEWNIYRFTMTAEETRLYINEETTPVMVFAPVAAGSNRHFRFGDGDSGRSFGADIDWVIWDTSGALAPGEGNPIPEGLDTSFYVPEEPEPHNWRIYDASVFPNESVPPFITSSGAFSETENEIIDDPDQEGNKLLWMNVNGTPNNQFFWRMNFFTQEIEFEELTIVIRSRAHEDRDMALDVDMHFNDMRTRISLHNETKLARIRNGEGTDAELTHDFSEWTIYRYTMTATETRLYVNEDPEPVLVCAPAVAASNNRHFRFGDGDSGNSMGADIDWVIWDYTGAYAPDEGSPIPSPVVTPNWDATLSSLLVNGEPIEGFDPEVTSYDLVLPAGTTEIPVISATANDQTAKILITQAAEIPGMANVEVTAYNGFTILNYEIHIRTISSDATLAEILLDGEPLEGFDPGITAYSIELAQGTTEVPEISAVANDEHAGIEITPAGQLPGETLIVVTAEDGSSITYTVAFTLDATSVPQLESGLFRLYPNPALTTLTIEWDNMEISGAVRIISMQGQVLYQGIFANTIHRINISDLAPGMYMLQLSREDQQIHKLFIKN